jgi:hypothetical protein
VLELELELELELGSCSNQINIFTVCC